MAKTNEDTKIAVMANDISYIKEEVDAINEKLEKDYITRQEFEAKFGPVRAIAFGIITLISLAVGGAIVGLVIIK